MTHHDLDGAVRTLKSLEALVRQAGSELEVLVIDGGTAEVQQGALTAVAPWASVTSEPDQGIYDAMNKGLRRSRGEWVWFLNGGDECLQTEWSPLGNELGDADENKEMLAYGYELNLGPARRDRRSPRAGWYLAHALPTSHQSIIYPGAHARDTGYDLSYRIAGDYAFTARLQKQFALRWKRTDRPLSAFSVGGISSVQSKQVAKDASRVQREILAFPLPLRAASRFAHLVSRTRRSLQSRAASRRLRAR